MGSRYIDIGIGDVWGLTSIPFVKRSMARTNIGDGNLESVNMKLDQLGPTENQLGS